ncbi:chromate transporter [uncultured Clostridium sp.]|uniref:chromate transporter n=1 Tax=uncultured Clostridium sp. TaxID=59620 RepID=UPI002626FD75|nr:chromate transporter [uncultured Clostridium sp.]
MGVIIKLYLAFLKIGALAFGGGYAMLPYIKTVLVNQNHWLTAEKLNSYIGLVQISPGPFTTNLSVYVGFKTAGILGGLAALLGIATVPFLLVTVVYLIFSKVQHATAWQNALIGMKPAIIALILSALISVSGVDVFHIREIIITAVGAYLLFVRKVQPVYIIIIAAVLGIILYM